MSAHPLAVEVFVWAGVVTAALASAAMLVMRDCYERMHLMAPVADVSAIFILVAVALQDGWGQAFIKMALICTVLIIMNAVLAHATSRAARVRELGTWNPQPNEASPGAGEGERKRQQSRRKNE